MYEPNEEPEESEEEPAYDWDAWEKNRVSGRGRLWLIVMAGTMAAMTLLYFQSDGKLIPWGPPG